MADEDDRISSLPDELLHGILLCLRSTCAAARTSVLSRRWRHVWAGVPDIVLIGDDKAPLPSPPASFLDTVDAALDAHAAPTVERLVVSLTGVREADAITSARAAPWLSFAAERVAGVLFLLVTTRLSSLRPVAVEELELPACGRAKKIELHLPDTWRLRPAQAGVFTALTDLTIHGHMEGSELTALVSTRCPCLKDLSLRLTLVDASDVSIRSDTLCSLSFWIWNSLLIEVMAPRLEKLSVSSARMARLSVPKLSELVWTGDYANNSHQFDNVSRSLHLLDITWDGSSGIRSIFAPMSLLLLQKFDEVDELKLNIDIPEGTAGYESFLNATNKLPKCKILNISLEWNGHGLAPSMFHLLRNCSSAKKFCARLNDHGSSQYSCPVSCSCHLAESCMVDDNALSSLEEVKINSCTSSHEELEFVELLSKCNATSLKHLVIDYDEWKFQAPKSKEICKKICNMYMDQMLKLNSMLLLDHGGGCGSIGRKICSMYEPNVEVEFYVVGQEKRVCLDLRLVRNVSSGIY